MEENTLWPGSLRENDMEELLRLYREYLEQAALPQNQKRPFQGAYGLIGGTAPNSFHQQFVQQVEAALAQVPKTERREAVEYIFHQPLEHKRNPTVYWMFVAVHGVVMPYLKDLTAEEARDLQWWYERSYPRREQTPVQRRLVALLKKMR